MEPSCCHTATSERRRIRLKADYYYIALREASFRRSQRGNSEAVFFRWVQPRRNSKVVNGFIVHLLVDVRSRAKMISDDNGNPRVNLAITNNPKGGLLRPFRRAFT